jgi:hypothetical protein
MVIKDLEAKLNTSLDKMILPSRDPMSEALDKMIPPSRDPMSVALDKMTFQECPWVRNREKGVL